jgi:hypothetical protein
VARKTGEKGYWKRTRKHRKRVGNRKEQLKTQRANNPTTRE